MDCSSIHAAYSKPIAVKISTVITKGCLVFLSWAVLWSIVGEQCLPGGNLFGLIVLFNTSVIFAKLVESIPIPKMPRLPGLLGMLLAGFALRNIPGINFAADIESSWSATIRAVALSVILVKAGLELDAGALKKMKGVCVRLTVIPCFVEALTCGAVCILFLGFSFQWGVLLGFVLGAVTPAVIVPSMLKLQNDGYGVAKGIPTLVIAASSFDDVLAISGFSVVLGIAFSGVSEMNEYAAHTSTNSTLSTTSATGSSVVPSTPSPNNEGADLAMTILRGPLEMIGGIVIGTLIGLLLAYLPHEKQRKHIVRDRTFLVVSIGVVSVLGCRVAGFDGSGPLIAIVAPFVAAFFWKDEKAGYR